MKTVIIILFTIIPFLSFSQLDSAFISQLKRLDTADILKADTAIVPNNALTQKIRTLLGEKNGLNIEGILKMKIMEGQQKDTTHSKTFYEHLLADVSNGKIARLLETCMINIYSKTFTEQEIDELTRFYQTSAGKKLNRNYLLILVESVKNGEQLLKLASKTIH